MRTIFRITSALLASVRKDLGRPHPFAGERVGFVATRPVRVKKGISFAAYEYLVLNDAEYIEDPGAAATMSSAAIRRALQFAYESQAAMFHVHVHEHRGMPAFSPVDLRENSRFMPDFFHVAPNVPHGALVLSSDAALGRSWTSEAKEPVTIDEIVEVGTRMRIFRPRQ